jgi:hypothetical protein
MTGPYPRTDGASGQSSFGIKGGETLVYYLEIASIVGKEEL